MPCVATWPTCIISSSPPFRIDTFRLSPRNLFIILVFQLDPRDQASLATRISSLCLLMLVARGGKPRLPPGATDFVQSYYWSKEGSPTPLLVLQSACTC